MMAAPMHVGAQERTVPEHAQDEFSHKGDLTEKAVEQSRPDDSPIKIETGEDKARLRVVTDSPLSPYLGAVKKGADAPEGLSTNNSDKPLRNYHLETGVGVRVNEQTKLNLGYRFNKAATPFDLGEDDASGQGDINFSLEIKFPF